MNHSDFHMVGRADDLLIELDERIKRHRKRFWKTLVMAVACTAMILGGTYLMIILRTYTKVNTMDSVKMEETTSGAYVSFADGVLRYSKDGIVLIGANGKEQWNQPSQLKNPMIDVCEDTAVVADKGGTSIMVFQKKGLKGEIKTTLPIEKIAVSAQGIVGVILRDETSPKVRCYDAAGNVLAEQKVSVTGNGYPVSIDMSSDGYKMLVSYMNVQSGAINSTVAFYTFAKEGGEDSEHKMQGESFQNEIIPMTKFMNPTTAFAVSNETLFLYKGSNEVKPDQKIALGKTIKNAFHSEKYIGFVLQNHDNGLYELRLYNMSGKVVMSKEIEESYSNVKIAGEEVIMYEGNKCSIYLRNGIRKFQGELEENILEITPLFGINKYLVMKPEELTVVRLVK